MEQKTSVETRIWHDMFGRKYEIYTYEPIEIACFNCLNKIEIQIPIRPGNHGVHHSVGSPNADGL